MTTRNQVSARHLLEDLRERLQQIRAEGDDLMPIGMVSVIEDRLQEARGLAPTILAEEVLPSLISVDAIDDGEPIEIMPILLRLDGAIRRLPNAWVERPAGRVPTGPPG